MLTEVKVHCFHSAGWRQLLLWLSLTQLCVDRTILWFEGRQQLPCDIHPARINQLTTAAVLFLLMVDSWSYPPTLIKP